MSAFNKGFLIGAVVTTMCAPFTYKLFKSIGAAAADIEAEAKKEGEK